MSARTPTLTYIAAEEPFIKVWGVVDHERFTMVETFLELHGPKLQHESSSLTNRNIAPNKRILVCTPPHYRRGVILQYNSTANIVVVRLLDLGSLLSIKPNEVIFFPPTSQFQHIAEEPALAEEYILYGAVKLKKWSRDETELAQRVLRLAADISVEMLWNKPCLRVTLLDNSNNSVLLTDFLAQRDMCVAITDDQMNEVMCRAFGSRQTGRQFSVPPPTLLSHLSPHSNSFPPMPNIPFNEPPMVSPSGMGNSRFTSNLSPPMRQQAQISPRQYDVETLPEGSRHEVFLSHVLDGMKMFTVQLKQNVDEKLKQLMARINEVSPKPISASLIPGTMCLGRNSVDKVLCRAVVTTVLADSANLYFVDFGHSDIVPFNEIYSIPPAFINEKVMALRFTLANLDQSALETKEAQAIFEEFVDTEESLVMVVTKPEMPLRQYCDLFIKENGMTVNIKQRILDKVKMMKPAEYKRIPFKPKMVVPVIITHVESPIRFFVQLEPNQSLMDVLSGSINEYARKESMKNFMYSEDVNENMAVCAKYSEDNLWYRGLITDEPDSKGYVNVFFVDYGNEDKVHYTTLRIMNNEMISQLPMQAVECRLDLDAKLASKPEVVAAFAQVVDEEESFSMTVINVLPGHVLLVELVDGQQRKVKERLVGQSDAPAVKQQNVTPPKSSQGNWRDARNPSNDGNFTAFHSRDNGYRSKADVDELDKAARPASNQNFWNKKPDAPQSNGYAAEKVDFSRQGGVANRSRPGDGAANDWNAGGNKRYEDERKPYGKNNDWNAGGGGRDDERKPYGKRDNNEWNAGGGGGGREDEQKPYGKRDNSDWNSRGAAGRDDRRGGGGGGGGGGGFRKNDEWSSNRGNDDRKPYGNKQDEWSSESKTEEWNSRNDEWATSKPKARNDEWTSGRPRSRNDEWSDKPKFDGGGGFQRKNDSHGDRKWGSRGDGASSVQPVQLLDEYEKGAQIAETTFEPGDELNVIVSWFLQPVQFYVKPAEDAEFRKLMETMQADYPRRKPTNVAALSANDYVVTRFTDNVIYRAKVIRNRPGAVLVSFVDYGNVDMARQGQVWTISGEHCAIPCQSVCCSLRNVVAAGESGQWPKSAQFDKYFGKNRYAATFVECAGEAASKTWSIELVDENGVNIADALAADGIATKTNVLCNEELYDLNLLGGQTLFVFPGYVESAKKFFVHVEPPKAQLIQTLIAKLTEEKVLKTLPAERIKAGEFCLAPAVDESYYRALIESADGAAEHAQVVYVDYGDSHEVAFSSLKILPDELMIYNPQMVECALHGGEAFADDAAFEEAISDKDFIIKVMDVVDDKLLVNVYDSNGARLPYPVASDETVHVLCPLPILRRFEKVNVTHIAADTVYVQRLADATCIDELCAQLREKYDAEPLDKCELEANVYYAAKSAKFEAWYRCKLPVAGATEVFYIDYGNTEPIEELLGVKPLDKKFFESPVFAVGVRTEAAFADGVDLQPLVDAVAELTFDATFEKSGGGGENDAWTAELRCATTGKTLSELAAELDCGSVRPTTERREPRRYAAFADWTVADDTRQVTVVNVNSPSSLFVHRAEDAARFAAMADALQSAAAKVFPLVGPPAEGLYAVRAVDAPRWMRARVSSDGRRADAFDYGLALTRFVAKKLPPKFIDGARYAVECALNVEPMGGGGDDAWPAPTIDRLKELVAAEAGAATTATLQRVRDDKRWIELKIESTNVADMLVNEGLAALKRYAVLVSHPASLREFYLQELADEAALYALGDELQRADEWETVAEPHEGDLVAAKFADDDRWYRATVTRCAAAEGGECGVRFVDYGNESTCCAAAVKRLPAALQAARHFAFRCRLHAAPDDADALTAAFVDFVYAFAGAYAASFVSGDAVALYCDGVPVVDAIRAKAAEATTTAAAAAVEDSTTTTTSGGGVVVTHINSPSSFYVQPETGDELVAIVQAMERVNEFGALDGPQPGDLVAAMFVDDGQWYRAKVASVADGVDVFFVDYGNSAAAAEFRDLPDAVKRVPFAAKHCAFALPAGLDGWPDAAKERFEELACAGDTVFKMAVVEDGDPAFVELEDAGCKVADELATLCKADLMAAATSRELAKSASVVLSYAHGWDAIWCQMDVAQVDEMTAEMENAGSFDALEAAAAGALVAALYDDDGLWYRAQVVEASADGGATTVLFIDYGNVEASRQLRTLPEDLVKLPPLATRCRLMGWPAEAQTEATLAKLQEYVNEMFVLAQSIREQDGTVVVELRSADNATSLVEMVTTTTTPPLAVESTAEVDESNDAKAEPSETAAEIKLETENPAGDEEAIGFSEAATGESAAAAIKTEADDEAKADERTVEEMEKCERDAVAAIDDLESPVENGTTTERTFVADDQESSDRGLASIAEETDVFVDSLSSMDENGVAANTSTDSAADRLESPPNDDDTVSTRFSEDMSEDYFTAYSGTSRIVECGGDVETLIADEELPESLPLLDDELSSTTRSECGDLLSTLECDLSALDTTASVDEPEKAEARDEPEGDDEIAESAEEKTNGDRASAEPALSTEENGSSSENASKSGSDESAEEKTNGEPAARSFSSLSTEENRSSCSENASKSGSDESDDEKSNLNERAPVEAARRPHENGEDKSNLDNRGPIETRTASSEEEKVAAGEVDAEPREETCHIIHVNSPSSFFIRRVDDFDRFEEMQKKLDENSSTLLTEDAAIGSLVSVYFEKHWRRAKLVENDETRGYWVKCVDYGTEFYADCLYKLPTEFATVPPFALHCGLQLPDEMTFWPLKIRQEFDSVTSEANAQFVIRAIEADDETTFVTLMKNGVNVGDKLKTMCQDSLVKSVAEVNLSEEDE